MGRVSPILSTEDASGWSNGGEEPVLNTHPFADRFDVLTLCFPASGLRAGPAWIFSVEQMAIDQFHAATSSLSFERGMEVWSG